MRQGLRDSARLPARLPEPLRPRLGSRLPAGWPPHRDRAADPRLRPGGCAAVGCLAGSVAALLLGLPVDCTEAQKHCWYFEGLYPTYYICHPYEDCCGSRCCVQALSIQRLWYFWYLLMIGVLFCCGAGFFIRRCMYPLPPIEELTFNVSYTRQPPNPTPGAQKLGLSWSDLGKKNVRVLFSVSCGRWCGVLS
uniref:WW domain binding protein VOPP1 n=1 Tax=Phocoena sinus TaxID=42100 RepID=A0A8C9E7J8_PHOSS